MKKFYLNPKNWFLSDIDKQILEIRERNKNDISLCEKEIAKLKFDGIALKEEILKISLAHKEITESEFLKQRLSLYYLGVELEKQILEVEHKYKEISDYDYEVKKASFKENTTERELLLLEIDKKYNKINENEYENKKATINKQPYIKVIDIQYKEGHAAAMSFDWNDIFVNEIEAAGYIGKTPEDSVNLWFTYLCRNIALETFDGVGDFNERLDEVVEAEEYMSAQTPKKKIKRNKQ